MININIIFSYGQLVLKFKNYYYNEVLRWTARIIHVPVTLLQSGQPTAEPSGGFQSK